MRRARATRATLAALVATMGVAIHEPSALADPSSDNRAAAEVLFERGRELVEHNRFAEACPQFAESQRLDPGIGTLLWLGDCYENTGQTASAWTAFSQAVSDATQRRDPRAAIARARAAKLEATLSRLTIVVSVEAASATDLQIHCDGILVTPANWGRAIPLDPGLHTITANAPNHRLWWTTAQLALDSGGTSVTVPALLPDTSGDATYAAAPGLASSPESPTPIERSGRTQRLAATAIAAGGATALAVGAFFALRARATYDASNDGPCKPDNECTPAGMQDRQSATSMATVATIAMGGGAAALLAAGALYLTAPKGLRVQVKAAYPASAGGGSIEAKWRW